MERSDGALQKYEAEKDSLHAGRKPREVSTGVTVKELADTLLNHKQTRLDNGELSPRTWKNYRDLPNYLSSSSASRVE